ncbi:hypothetical protein V6N13_059328 [Hibiscus sabdariffa]
MQAWELVPQQVIIELDSEDALRLLRDSHNRHRCLSILNHIDVLRGRDWLVAFRHVHRNGNKVADAMAKLADRSHLNCLCFMAPPVEVESLFQEDAVNSNML